MSRNAAIVLLSAILAGAVASQNFMSHFGTKTVYFHRPPIKDALPWTHENVPRDLKVLRIDATLRHGTRYPSQKRAEKFEKVAPKFAELISKVSDTLYRSVKNWMSKFTSDKYNLLSKLGWEEHLHLGMKFYSMAPEFWRESASRGRVNVQSSIKVRALTSARAFLTAVKSMAEDGDVDLNHPDIAFDPQKMTNESNTLDESDEIQYFGFKVKIANDLLRFFDTCRKYSEMVTKNKTSKIEYKKYFKTDTYRNIAREIIGDIDDPKEVYHIYLLCAFEMVNFNDSVWCQLFQEKHIPYFEYAADLKHFYKTGNGYGINYEQSCVLLRDVIHQLENESNAITLRFSHAETLIPLVSLLGFFNESTNLRSDNFLQMTHRNFRTSTIGPFSGNLAIILYSSRSTPSAKFISFVLNEYIVKPFGLDCFFCEYNPKSAAYEELRKKIVNCDAKCHYNDNIKDEL